MIKKIQPYITYFMIRGMQVFARLFYRTEVRWVGGRPAVDSWRESRLVIILHHTSLYEWLYAAVVSKHFLWRIASESVVPVADKTINRPIIGHLFSIIAHQVVPLTRKRDHTWARTLQLVKKAKLMIMLPEGRMQRSTGLDSKGRPMDIRGGIADVIETIGQGGFLIAYSGGLHHIQHPGQTFPRLFRTVRMNLEFLDLEEYRRECREQAEKEGRSFRDVVRENLQHRRDTLCPTDSWTEAHGDGSTVYPNGEFEAQPRPAARANR
ncbi:MAG: 1-acyl-sn-glycerol-3-phosphate acyltransferase [Acidobacteriota bacterium]